MWNHCNASELGPLITDHYSRRHPPRPGQKLGGVGRPIYLRTDAGSALIATLQTRLNWPIPWRLFPSWWLGLFRRHPAEPAPASELVRAATRILAGLEPIEIFTAIDLRKIKSRVPGLCFLRAGWRPICSTRPLKRCRSLLIFTAGRSAVAGNGVDAEYRGG